MRALLLLSLVATNAAVAQQQVPTRTLGKPDVELTDPFSRVSGLRELRDGRVIVADSRDKTLQAIDLASKRAVPIGREGSGPTEWALPTNVLAMPGDTTLIGDMLNSRFLVVGPDGKALRTYSPIADDALVGGARSGSPPDRGGGGGGRGPGGGGQIILGGAGPLAVLTARATDAKGRLYITGAPVVISDAGIKSADSIPIIRTDLAGKKQDTLAWLRQAKNNASGSSTTSGGQTEARIQIGGAAPFQAGDDFTVFPDGRIAIVRASDFHVDVVQADGRRVSGGPFKYSPVRIGEAEKEEWRNARRNGQSIQMSNNNGNVTRSVGSGAGAGAPPEPTSWPTTKSAFGNLATWAAPNGDTWVFHARAASDKTPVAEVFDAKGQLIGKIALPVNTRLLGFGARSVYLARADEDDLLYLQRYPMQWSGCPAELKENCR